MTPAAVAVRLKLALVVVHRWLGIFGSLFCVGWFASGLVLLVAPYPGFRVERPRTWAPPLDCARCITPVTSLQAKVRVALPYERLRVGMRLDDPVLRLRGPSGPWRAFPLDPARPFHQVDSALAEAIARRALGMQSPVAMVERFTEADQWTVEYGYRREAPF